MLSFDAMTKWIENRKFIVSTVEEKKTGKNNKSFGNYSIGNLVCTFVVWQIGQMNVRNWLFVHDAMTNSSCCGQSKYDGNIHFDHNKHGLSVNIGLNKVLISSSPSSPSLPSSSLLCNNWLRIISWTKALSNCGFFFLLLFSHFSCL